MGCMDVRWLGVERGAGMYFGASFIGRRDGG